MGNKFNCEECGTPTEEKDLVDCRTTGTGNTFWVCPECAEKIRATWAAKAVAQERRQEA